ncbi:hypothetical protein AAKU64_004572 [Undibacterium sp. GrIS 1.8]|uniref:hypothetical protein n=1 Tax=unclassified Undibacterium TaxID=2630295 RepID=UPI0033941389
MNTKQQSIKPFLEVFNAVHEDSGNNHAFDSSNGNTKKIDLSNYELTQLGYTDFVGMDGAPKALNLKQDKQGRYDSTQGQKNRNDFLRYKEDTTDSNGVLHKKGDLFKDTDPSFKGTILP